MSEVKTLLLGTMAALGIDYHKLVFGNEKARKYRTVIDYGNKEIELHNAEVVVKRLANPRTKRQRKELAAAQALLAKHTKTVAIEESNND